MEERESSENEAAERPRDVSVVHFVKERVRQMAELIQAVDNRLLVAGEVTKGPRTAVQRLPRHMRRRAMSYNVKRLPRSQHRFAKSAVAASKHRKKPPSRFWRRRPRNLLLNYIRRQRKYVWLETHIWHAKRFRMVDKWNYKLPFCSYQRAFRPSYRDAMRHCVVQDVSFLRCFQIICSDQLAVTESLRKLCAPEVGPTFAFRAALNGRFEMPVMLYEPGQYPHGFIAPVRFLWTKDRSGGEYTLVIWTHPSSSNYVLAKLVDLLKLKKQDQAEETAEIAKVPRNIDEWRLRNLQIRTDTYANEGGLKLLDLSDQLIRFRLHGPKSFAVLNEVLAVVEENEMKDSWMKEFILCNQFWTNECCKHGAGELPDGTVLSLLVEDPRLTRPLRKRKPGEANPCSAKPLDLDSLPLPQNDFWNFEVRKKTLEMKLTEADLQKKRSTQLQPVKTSKAKIPVLLVARNAGKGTTNPFTGLDLIVPSGFGLEFWLALQYGTARSIGLRDQKFLEFESSHLNFPSDVPDSASGRNESKEEYINLQEKYLRRPHNRRVKYWSSLSIKYPFTFQFSELSRNWLNDSGSVSADTAHVVRDRRMLITIEKWLAGKGPAPEDSVLNSAVLVPISLISFVTGRPLRFALICAPTDEDFSAVVKWAREEKAMEIVEQPRASTSKLVPTGQEKEEEKESQNRLEDFISLDVAATEKLISLDSLFPDKELQRKRKVKERKKAKREKAKAAKRFRTASAESGQHTSTSQHTSDGTDMVENEDAESVKYNTSCSRPIIGRVVRGDYSFIHGKGFAIGYCCLPALKLIRSGRVLFRNTTSRHYHPARISILKNQLDL